MTLFTIDISPLLASPVGSMEEFQFAREIDKTMWEDLKCVEDLSMHIKLVRQEYGIECIILDLKTMIDIPSEGLEHVTIEISNISREFHIKKNSTDTDEIEYINPHDGTLDLSQIIEQELLIAGL